MQRHLWGMSGRACRLGDLLAPVIGAAPTFGMIAGTQLAGDGAMLLLPYLRCNHVPRRQMELEPFRSETRRQRSAASERRSLSL